MPGSRPGFRWIKPRCPASPTRPSPVSPGTTACEDAALNILAGFADISVAQLLLVAGVALFAAIIGGLASYGTGALMPLVLVPLIGAEPVGPIIAISAVFTNLSRAAAYLRYADRRRALIVIAAAAFTTALGAYGYTRLTNAGAALVIGTMLIASVPLRHLLR